MYASPCRVHEFEAAHTYCACDSIMISAEVWPVALFGPSSMKKFGKPGHHHRAERLHAIAPHVAQAFAVAADDVHVVGDVERAETGRFDDDVDRVQLAGGVAHAVGLDRAIGSVTRCTFERLNVDR